MPSFGREACEISPPLVAKRAGMPVTTPTNGLSSDVPYSNMGYHRPLSNPENRRLRYVDLGTVLFSNDAARALKNHPKVAVLLSTHDQGLRLPVQQGPAGLSVFKEPLNFTKLHHNDCQSLFVLIVRFCQSRA